MSKQKKSKRKLSKKKISLVFVVVFIILFVIKIYNTNITNIYIQGNEYLSDQEIIDISGIGNYPKSLINFSFKIKKELLENQYIYKAKVKKNFLLNKVYIEVEENYPLFYYAETDETAFYNGKKVNDKFSNSIVINYIPDKVYKNLVKEFKKINIDVINRISEIKYEPNERYEDRLLLLMTDGNYVYITLDKFSTLNKYLDIIKYIGSDEKGIIRLDSGMYFDEFDK